MSEIKLLPSLSFLTTQAKPVDPQAKGAYHQLFLEVFMVSGTQLPKCILQEMGASDFELEHRSRYLRREDVRTFPPRDRLLMHPLVGFLIYK